MFFKFLSESVAEVLFLFVAAGDGQGNPVSGVVLTVETFAH